MKATSILILGGGALGLHQIHAARQAGFYTIVTDQNPDAPGLKEADLGVPISATDIPALVSFVRAHTKTQISAVYCGNDFGLVAVEHIKYALGLPHNSVEAALRCTDKKLMKECFLRDGIPAPQGFYASSPEAVVAKIDRITLPAIVKPTDSSGSRGITVVSDERELAAAVQEAFAHSSAGVLVEEYLVGTHHDVNGFFFNNLFYPCGVMDRFFTPLPYCVPVRGYYPSSLPPDRVAECYALLERAARSVGVTEGAVKGDFVLSGDTLYIYEVSNRFHGDVSTAHLYTFCGERSSLERYMQTLFRQEATPEEVHTGKVCGWFLIPLAPGVLREDIVDDIRGVEGVEKVFWLAKPGDTIREIKNNNDMPGFVWIRGDTRDEVDARYRALSQVVMNATT